MDWKISFGEFGRLFGSVEEPSYLSLLNLNIRGSEAVLAVRMACHADPDPYARIEAMLSSGYGWRPHLVGGVALRFIAPRSAEIGALWNAADVSWVGPQMAALAARLDPEFDLNAGFRISCGCRHRPQFPSRFQPNWPDAKPRGQFALADSDRPPNVKLLGALTALSEAGSGLQPADRNEDFELGATIARTWMEKLDRLIEGLPTP